MQIKGDYYEANKSQRHEVLFYIETDNRVAIKPLHVKHKNIFQNADIKEIEISPRIGQTPRSITFSDGAIFETLENDLIDQWLKQKGSHNSLAWIHNLESKLIYVITTLVFVGVFSWAFIQFGVPSIASATAKVLPIEINQQLGQGTLTLLDKSYFSPSELSASRQTQLLTQFNQYIKDYPDLNIDVVFRRGGDIGANAFALPNGQIVFTDEMVKLSEDDLELVAIFGHEIGHLEHRHLLRRLIQDSLLTSLVVLLTGDISYASTVIIALPVLLLELSYSRGFEVEADQFALEFLTKNNIEPNHFAHIMTRLSKQHENKDEAEKKNKEASVYDGVSNYLSTHPVTQERIKPFLINGQ